ncbi:hypothetical protein HMPREF1990_01282 [Porphyromonas gingivalis W4087]|uniref:Uncharacterized protein n=1 Tax=Porphyromonas gingivalis F0570 TaxID=1227271 RepID=A0A0E2M3B9_PORGN|nr:hypothetical protein HMPREF1555_01954 [Porphyromonas gingivalis F0570]ERJ81052.1 hypothetical protein HMPREF1988_02129 [Porphyromonas gingivalis F0185]ERJ88436.1 hypothetical protein HMPREF1990_01282 [Porphyromonas gingivalis W4087]
MQSKSRKKTQATSVAPSFCMIKAYHLLFFPFGTKALRHLCELKESRGLSM